MNKITRLITAGLIGLFALSLTGCKSEPNIVFESNIYDLRDGETATLTWDVLIDDDDVISHEVTINDIAVEDPQGSMDVFIGVDTPYTLTDRRTLEDGSIVEVSKTITLYVSLLLENWHPKDAGLRDCIKSENPNAVYARSVTRVDQCSKFITSFEGIQYLRNLESLQLSRGSASDLTPLKHLDNLYSLFIASYPIKDITPIVHLPKLSSLYLIDTWITDISPLNNLQTPWYIMLSGNAIDESLLTLDTLAAKFDDWGYIDLRNDQVTIPSLKQIDCEIVNTYRETTNYEDRFIWPNYCEE